MRLIGMLAFIDESDHPSANGTGRRPVVAAVCLDEQDARTINERVYAIKRDVLGIDRAELKGRNILNRPTYRRKVEARAFAEDFFASLQDMPVTVFATVMAGPFQPRSDDNILENRFRILVRRIELLATERNVMTSILFDGDGSQLSGLNERFRAYFYGSCEGKGNVHIVDTPAFVDSASSVGIQIADMCAYVVRVYHESRLSVETPPQDDLYLQTVRSWYRAIEQRTRNFYAPNGELIPGFLFMAPGDY